MAIIMDHPLGAGGSGPSHLRILSRPDWVEPVAMYLRERAVESGVCTAESARRLAVAMTEAITNAIIHGNYGLDSALKDGDGAAFRTMLKERQADPRFVGRVVDIRADHEPGRCVWTVTDQGDGFDVDDWLVRTEHADPAASVSSGRGISIMRAFVDEVSWTHGGRRIRLAIDHEHVSEKRQSVRRKYTAAVRVDRPGDGTATEAIARDLSSTGIAFVSSEPMIEGDAVVVTLDAGRPTARRVTGRIVRCRSISGPYHDVAVHFDRDIGTIVRAILDVT